jgi:hypothetical protein
VSHASENPVPCARAKDLGCTASHPSGRWGAIRADRDGWFHSLAEEKAFCPEHVPDWVPAWRARQAAKLHKVKGSFTRLSPALACTGCKLHQAPDGDDPELLRELRDAAFEHARQTGHKVTVTATEEWTVEPADE